MWVDVQQNTPEWEELRIGKIGGSSIGTIMAYYGKAFGEPAHDLALRIALEQIRGVSCGNSYTNAHMERGHEQEPIARYLYENEYFCDVTNGGYFIMADDLGVSPDGLVSDCGVIEIKSVIPKTHFKNISRGSFDPSYKWQLALELMGTDREWIDFVSFCAEFPEGKKLCVYRHYSCEFQDEFGMIKTRLDQFRELVAEKKRIIQK